MSVKKVKEECVNYKNKRETLLGEYEVCTFLLNLDFFSSIVFRQLVVGDNLIKLPNYHTFVCFKCRRNRLSFISADILNENSLKLLHFLKCIQWDSL